MLRIRLLLPLLGCALLPLTACDDPASDVGIGLVEAGAEPVVRTLAASTFEEMIFADITGGTERMLSGRVNDPLIGTIDAIGYLDFASMFDVADTSPITSVTLNLTRNYVYGDTTMPVTLDVYDLADEWNALGAPADTSLTLGEQVTSITFMPLDTLVSIPLPSEWIEANETTLRSSTFSESFHGLALQSMTAEAVAGFAVSQSSFRVITEQDTFSFSISKSLSGLQRTGEPSLPEGRILLQDGAGPIVKLNFDFDGLEEAPLNGAIVRLFADTLSVLETPPNFVRPRVETLQLVRIDSDEQAFLIAEATLSDGGDYRFSDLALRNILQQVFFGETLFEHLELRVPFSASTLNVMLLYDAASGDTAPEALLTISPTD